MPQVYTICLDAPEAFGLRLVEERRKLDGAQDQVEVRTKVGAIRPEASARVIDRVAVGDILFQIGFKGPSMKSWQWESVAGYTLEDVVAAIREAKREGLGRCSMRLIRYDADQGNGQGWISGFTEEYLVESTVKREVFVEKKKGEVESSSVRVGDEYQCIELPIPGASKLEGTFEEESPAMVFAPQRISEELFDQYITELFGGERIMDHHLELALICLHHTDYEPASANQLYRQIHSGGDTAYGICTRGWDWPDDKKQRFENSINRVGCRDFRAVRDSMLIPSDDGSVLSVPDIVAYFYTHWKVTPQYLTWDANKKPRDHVQSIRRCLRCDGDDPTLEALSCQRCSACCHMECLDKPLIRALRCSPTWKNWTCWKCLQPEPYAKKPSLSIAQPKPTPQIPVVSTSRRSTSTPSASASLEQDKSSKRAAAQHQYYREYNDEEEDDDDADVLGEDFDDDDDEDHFPNGRKRKIKRARAGKNEQRDPQGRRIHFLKGAPIVPESLIRVVEEKGGFDRVVNGKLWQQIRKELDLPHTTSSSTQLRDAYVAYTTGVYPSRNLKISEDD